MFAKPGRMRCFTCLWSTPCNSVSLTMHIQHLVLFSSCNNKDTMLLGSVYLNFAFYGLQLLKFFSVLYISLITYLSDEPRLDWSWLVTCRIIFIKNNQSFLFKPNKTRIWGYKHKFQYFSLWKVTAGRNRLSMFVLIDHSLTEVVAGMGKRKVQSQFSKLFCKLRHPILKIRNLSSRRPPHVEVSCTTFWLRNA